MLWMVALVMTVGCLSTRERFRSRALDGGLAAVVCLLTFQSCAVAKAVPLNEGRVDQVWLGFALNPEGRVTPGCTASQFALGDPIHLSLHVSDAAEGSMLHVTVRDIATQRIAWREDSALSAGESHLTFAIGRKLGRGNYVAESSLGGEAASSRAFLVHDRYAHAHGPVSEDLIVSAVYIP